MESSTSTLYSLLPNSSPHAIASKGSKEGDILLPHSISIEKNILIADTGNHRVQEFSVNGQFLSSFGKQGGANGELKELLETLQPMKFMLLTLETSVFKYLTKMEILFVLFLVKVKENSLLLHRFA